ncbi:hypothetical protein ACU63Y_20735 [Klebsiella aerogenes]
MIRQWMFLYWVNHFIIAANAIYFSYCFMPIDSWFVMPCLIVSVMCMVPMFFSFTCWSALRVNNDYDLYLLNIFFKKVIVSTPFILLIFAWAWWGGGMAILVGSVIASWLGNIVFWVVDQDALSAVLPERTASRQCSFRGNQADAAVSVYMSNFSGAGNTMLDGGCCNKNNEYVNTSVSVGYSTTNTMADTSRYDSFNPASGLPMAGSGFDVQGNTYGTNSSDNNC